MNQERIYITKHDKPTDTRTANIGNVAGVPQIVGHEYSFPLLSLKPGQKITSVRGNQAGIATVGTLSFFQQAFFSLIQRPEKLTLKSPPSDLGNPPFCHQ